MFPRTNRSWSHLDDHYWSRKRLVGAGILVANLAIYGEMLTRAIPAWNDWLFYFYFVGYLVALAGLIVSRSRRLDLLFLCWAIAINLGTGSDLLPGSAWGQQVGLSFAVQGGPHLSPSQ